MQGTPIRAIAITATALLAFACGGGAELGQLSGVIGSGGTGIGVATGFGSVIVDGVRRDDSSAVYFSDENHPDLVQVGSTSATLGQVLEYDDAAAGAISAVRISPALVGPVTAVDAGGFTVLGTRVDVNLLEANGPVTALVGYASPSAVQTGDRVAVYGLPDAAVAATSAVRATQIVRKASGTGVRLSGAVARYDAASRRFTIGASMIDTARATVVPAGAAIAEGDWVTVWSDAAPAGTVIAASRVRVRWAAGATGARTLSGRVTDLTDAAHFKLSGIAIDASAASVTPAGALAAAARYATVSGRYDGATGRLLASRMTIYAPPAGGPVELHGTVANFVSSSSFTVRGAVVDASGARFAGGAASALANGAFVVVQGTVAGDAVRARSVEIVAPTPAGAPSGATLDLIGTVAAFDAAAGRCTIALASGGMMNATLGAMTFFAGGSASSITVGQTVSVRGVFDGSALVASTMSVGASMSPGGGASMPGETTMEGVVTSVTASGFTVNGVTILTTGVTAGGGSMMGGRAMMAGTRVAVTARYSAGQYVATAITWLGD